MLYSTIQGQDYGEFELPLAVKSEPLGEEEMPQNAVPLYFRSGANTLFGWLHAPPTGTIASLGLVICNPFGIEAMCAHRSIRTVAESAAGIGIPSLRFDYAGTGDSSDIDPKADQTEAWLTDIVNAVQFLREVTGVSRVCLLGLRLGGLLAHLAASRSAGVEALILVQPVVNGARYLRELKMARMAGMARQDTAAPPAERPISASVADATPLECNGYSMSPSTVAALSGLRLASTVRPVDRMLVVDDDIMPTARAWTASVANDGKAYVTMAGVLQIIFTDPFFAIAPTRLYAEVRAWLAEEAGGGEADPARPIGDIESMVGDRISPELCIAGEGPGAGHIIERPVCFGGEAALFGVATEPADGRSGKAIILINAGAEIHVGSNRLYVSLARRWARDGHVTLRIDIAGIGDSTTRAGQSDNYVFPPDALKDVRAAIEFVRSRYEVAELHLAGLCSGAYHAVRAAVARFPIDGILLINQMDFLVRNDSGVKDLVVRKELHIAEVVGNPRLFRDRIFSWHSWQDLLTGRRGFWRLLYVYVRSSVLGLEASLRKLLRVAHLYLPRDFGRELEGIAARKVRIVFIYGDGDPAGSLLKLLAGNSLRRLGKKCVFHQIPGDHTFTQSSQRRDLMDLLSLELAQPSHAPDHASKGGPFGVSDGLIVSGMKNSV